MAYINQRDEEEQRPGISGGGGFAGGMAGQAQAGVQRGTGGTAPWVNIQRYLSANPADMSGKQILEKEFAQPLESSISSAKGEVEGARSILGKEVGEAEKALTDTKSSMDQARSALRGSIYNFQPNVYRGATDKALELSKTKFDAPAFSPKSLDPKLESQFAQLKDPYGYLSQQYSNQGLTSGQRALQEQLTRKSTAFPSLTSALSGKYAGAKSEIESANKAMSDDIKRNEELYRGKLAQNAKAATDFDRNQNELLSMLGAGKQQEYANILGIPSFMGNAYSSDMTLPQIGKSIQDAQKVSTDSAYRAREAQYNKLIEALLNRYGFN